MASRTLGVGWVAATNQKGGAMRCVRVDRVYACASAGMRRTQVGQELRCMGVERQSMTCLRALAPST
eukprot:365524-Chlamydomonas_euryale.AAC.8